MQKQKIINFQHKYIILQILGGLQLLSNFNYDKALQYFLEQIQFIVQSEGRWTLKWVQALHNIGIACLNMKQIQKAKQSFLKCLTHIRKQEIKKIYYFTYVSDQQVQILINLIEIEIRFNHSQKVQQYFKQICSIKQEVQKQTQKRIYYQNDRFYNLAGNFYTSISIAYQQKQQLENSLIYAIKALQNYQQSDQDYNFTYCNRTKLLISYLLQKNNKIEESLKKYHQVQKDITSLKGQRILIVADIKNQIGCLYIKLGQYENGIQILKKQMEIRNHFLKTEKFPFAFQVSPNSLLPINKNCFMHVNTCIKQSQKVLEDLIETNPQIYEIHMDFILERNIYVEKIANLQGLKLLNIYLKRQEHLNI